MGLKVRNLMSAEEYQKLQKMKKHCHREATISPETWKLLSIPQPLHNYRFHAVRKWAFDYAWPDLWVAVELEGGFRPKDRPVICHQCKTPVMAMGAGGRPYTVQLSGSHAGVRYKSDLEKYNEAATMGWTVLRYLPSEINYGQIADLVLQKRLICEQRDTPIIV